MTAQNLSFAAKATMGLRSLFMEALPTSHWLVPVPMLSVTVLELEGQTPEVTGHFSLLFNSCPAMTMVPHMSAEAVKGTLTPIVAVFVLAVTLQAHRLLAHLPLAGPPSQVPLQ
jgi:hypothetical protein